MPRSKWFTALVLCAVIALAAGHAEAVVTQYKIDDLTEPPIKAFVNTGAGDVEIGGGCNALVEQCFITIPLLAGSPATAMDVVYLTEPKTTPPALSDILILQEFQGENTAELRFCSDPNCPPPPFTQNPPADASIEEDGTFQLLLMLRGARFGDGIDVYVRSDVERVPEPSTLMLMTAAMGLLAWVHTRTSRWRRGLLRPIDGAMAEASVGVQQVTYVPK